VTRERWAEVAPGWERYAEAFHVRTMPVSAWMVDAIAPQPGHMVLDLAAGIGDTGFLAAELIEPGGTLITSDFAPEMLTAAQRRAAALGLGNVRFRQVDATQPIDVAAASLDGVLCRWGYMLMADAEAAVRETRRVLRPGGRLALAVWTEAGENPWSSLPVKLLVERGLIDRPEPGPGQFAWAPEGVIAEHLENAGFVEYEVDTIEFTMGYESVREWWHTTRAMGQFARQARIEDEPEWLDTLAREVAGWTAADGSVAIPARTWVAAATA
jgi:ubiquinone/menaquinone biosynthesis C-methylase UbiE